MSTFSENPHPSDDNISGTVCSLLLSDGNTEIKLANLTEMIAVHPDYFQLTKEKESVIFSISIMVTGQNGFKMAEPRSVSNQLPWRSLLVTVAR